MPRKAGQIPSAILQRYTGAYDPNEFLVPAADKHGHAERVIARVGLDYVTEIDRVVTSRLFPWSDRSAFLRWAIREALLAVSQMETIPNTVLGMAEASMLTMREVLHHRTYESTFEQAREAFGILQTRGALGEIRKLYARLQYQYDQMPDSYWRGQYRARLHDEFGHLVDPRGEAGPEGSVAWQKKKQASGGGGQ